MTDALPLPATAWPAALIDALPTGDYPLHTPCPLCQAPVPWPEAPEHTDAEGAPTAAQVLLDQEAGAEAALLAHLATHPVSEWARGMAEARSKLAHAVGTLRGLQRMLDGIEVLLP